MYCRVFVCDFDGTGASNGQLVPEVAAALAAAQAQGFVTMLATGRVFEEVQSLCPDLSMFNAVVAENGAIVHLPAEQRTIQLGQPPPRDFLGALQARGVPFQSGAVVIGTWDRHAAEVLALIREFAIDAHLVFNRAAMMVLPSGVDKAVGVQRALEELGRSEHNTIAFGDAENDLPLFTLAGVAVAPRGAAATVAVQADVQLSQPGGTGVAGYVHKVVADAGVVPTPARHSVVLGHTADGTPARLPACGTNVMITGDPRSGKSWLVGLVAEQLIDRGLRVCLIDPEGGNLALADRPHVLTLGSDLVLPEPAAVYRLLRSQPVSVVLNVAALSHAGQVRYVDAVVGQLEQLSRDTGKPHWILIDEAQYFFHKSAPGQACPGRSPNFVFVTYRPSLIASDVYAGVGAHVIAPTLVEEERYFITSLLRARGPRDLIAADALRGIEPGRAGLLIEDPVQPRWQIFTLRERLTAHTHHARKYVDTRLTDDRAFWFLKVDGSAPVPAHNVAEFHGAVRSVPLASLRHHLSAGDFSKWAADVLGDERLASDLRKLELATRAGASIDRSEVLAYVEEYYLIESKPQREGTPEPPMPGAA